jgi:hypothetical protein
MTGDMDSVSEHGRNQLRKDLDMVYMEIAGSTHPYRIAMDPNQNAVMVLHTPERIVRKREGIAHVMARHSKLCSQEIFRGASYLEDLPSVIRPRNDEPFAEGYHLWLIRPKGGTVPSL